MADWKVSVEEIEIMPHPDAEKMDLGLVGEFGIVVGKGSYQTGDKVIFAPKRSIIPVYLRDLYENTQTKSSYLKGGHTVKSVRLRGELSEGVVIPFDRVKYVLGTFNIDDIEVGTDISEKIGIEQYSVPIPKQLAGNMKRVTASKFSRHDCQQFRLYESQFEIGEEVVVTEKIHGSQINIMFLEDDTVELSSKGLLGKDIAIEQSTENTYWQALYNSGLIEKIETYFGPGRFVQLMGEVTPIQSGFSYGDTIPTIRPFRLEVDHVMIGLEEIEKEYPELYKVWVPELYRGPFDSQTVINMSCYDGFDNKGKPITGKEKVSGKELHIREGGVLQPLKPRISKKGNVPLIVKIIAPAYAKKFESDDDIS